MLSASPSFSSPHSHQCRVVTIVNARDFTALADVIVTRDGLYTAAVTAMNNLGVIIPSSFTATGNKIPCIVNRYNSEISYVRSMMTNRPSLVTANVAMIALLLQADTSSPWLSASLPASDIFGSMVRSWKHVVLAANIVKSAATSSYMVDATCQRYMQPMYQMDTPKAVWTDLSADTQQLYRYVASTGVTFNSRAFDPTTIDYSLQPINVAVDVVTQSFVALVPAYAEAALSTNARIQWNERLRQRLAPFYSLWSSELNSMVAQFNPTTMMSQATSIRMSNASFGKINLTARVRIELMLLMIMYRLLPIKHGRRITIDYHH